MTRTFSALGGLLVLALGFSVLLAGCSGEAASEPVDTAPDAAIETVALTVGGMI